MPICEGSYLVSVVMPVFNERDTIERIVDRVLNVPIQKELIIVDDGSTDGTRTWLQKRFSTPSAGSQQAKIAIFGTTRHSSQVRVLYQPRNTGKGAALRRGFKEAKGDIVLVQDADLEYDPQDYHRLLEPLLNHQADVVYGSRFLGQPPTAWPMFAYLGNKVVTALVNALTGFTLTDVWTGYKVFHRKVLEGMPLQESGFELEIELTAKIAHGKWRVREVPIRYVPRTKAEGKKIRWLDGIKALQCTLRYRNPA
ncbi:MAG: glycosyltransferase family 2 protein [Nitrospirales bacterium]